MGSELVTVRTGGMQWTAFERILVRASFKEAARSFNLSIAAEAGDVATAWTFDAGTSVDILFNNDLAMRGYVDRYQPKFSEHKEKRAQVSGRSRSQDLIDSSALHKTGRFKNKTPAQIGQELDQAGVGVSADVQLDKVPAFQLVPGETIFRCLEQLCRDQGATITSPPDGSLLMTKAGTKRHAGGLIQGVNIKEGDADHNWSGRHSKVIVRGQRPFGHGPDALEVEATALDSSVGRHRPIVIMQGEDTDKARAGKRARKRRNREAGEALKANITVQGFRDDAGELWTPGYLIFTQAPFLKIEQDMLVETVQFSQARGSGSETTLSLVDPRAYDGKSGKGGKAGKSWSTDAGGEE